MECVILRSGDGCLIGQQIGDILLYFTADGVVAVGDGFCRIAIFDEVKACISLRND